MVRNITIPYLRIPANPSAAFPDQMSVYVPAFNCQMRYRGRLFPKTFLSIIDSGSDHCIFPADFGRQIGIDIEAGPKGQPIVGITAGGSPAHYHEVTLALDLVGTKGIEFECYAGFVDGATLGVLGRAGFFDLCRSVLLNERERKVEIEIDYPK